MVSVLPSDLPHIFAILQRRQVVVLSVGLPVWQVGPPVHTVRMISVELVSLLRPVLCVNV